MSAVKEKEFFFPVEDLGKVFREAFPDATGVGFTAPDFETAYKKMVKWRRAVNRVPGQIRARRRAALRAAKLI